MAIWFWQQYINSSMMIVFLNGVEAIEYLHAKKEKKQLSSKTHTSDKN